MNVKITQDSKNPLLSRREIEFQIVHENKPTPTKRGVAEFLAAKLNANIKNMIVKNYKTRFGGNVSEGMCFVYDSQETMIKSEPTKLLNPKKRVGIVEAVKEEAKEQGKEAESVKEEAKEKSGETNEAQTKQEK